MPDLHSKRQPHVLKPHQPGVGTVMVTSGSVLSGNKNLPRGLLPPGSSVPGRRALPLACGDATGAPVWAVGRADLTNPGVAF